MSPDGAGATMRLEELEAELRRLKVELAAVQGDAARFRTMLESATEDAILTLDSDGRITSWNSGAVNLLGWRREEAFGLDSRLLFTPEDRQKGAAEAEMARALREGWAENERWHLRKDGNRFWGSGTLVPIRDDPAGGFLKIMRDRTKQREGAERQSLLLRELAHRVKNSLALILSMARQTATRAESLAGFLEMFEGRLRALAAAHDLMTDSGWLHASLPDLTRIALGPHLNAVDGRLQVQVPSLDLTPTVAQDLVLALHELATNAAKHGALSRPEGWVALDATIEADDLVLRWRERAGPAVRPPDRRGFGTLLLEHVVSHQHGGKMELDWQPGGLACVLRLPVATSLDQRAPRRPPDAALSASAAATAAAPARNSDP